MYSNLEIALTVFFAIFVVLDIFINVILGLAIHRKKSLQTPMNLLIFHLAICDILIGVFITPRHLLSYAITYPNDTSSDYICKLITGGNFIWTSVTASSGFLTIIALERLFAVVYPHKNRLRITKRRLKWLVGACWLTSFVFNLPSLLVLEYDHEAHFCMERWPSWVDPKAYVGFAFFAGNFSVISMFILYGIILYSLWKRSKSTSEVSRTARTKARRRVTKMLILMTIFHMFCRTPNYTFYMLIYFDPNAAYGSIVYSFTVFLILLNSASHPFFYCWYMDNLRRQVFAILPPICSGHCPARLRSFNLVSATEELGSTLTDSQSRSKAKETALITADDEMSEVDIKRNKKVKQQLEQGAINKEMEISDSSVKSSEQGTPMIVKKMEEQQLANDCDNIKIIQHMTVDDTENKDRHSHCDDETMTDEPPANDMMYLSLNNDDDEDDNAIQQNGNEEREGQKYSEENVSEDDNEDEDGEGNIDQSDDNNAVIVTTCEKEDMKQVEVDGETSKERSDSSGIPVLDIKDIILESEPIDV